MLCMAWLMPTSLNSFLPLSSMSIMFLILAFLVSKQAILMPSSYSSHVLCLLSIIFSPQKNAGSITSFRSPAMEDSSEQPIPTTLSKRDKPLLKTMAFKPIFPLNYLCGTYYHFILFIGLLITVFFSPIRICAP